MALFKKSAPNHRQGITGLTKPAPIPAAAKRAQSAGGSKKLAILIPALAFVAVGGVAFSALQKLSTPQQTITVYSSAPPSGLAAQMMFALKVPHDREKEVARLAMLNDVDGPMVVKPLDEVVALTQPDRVFYEKTPKTEPLEVENVQQVAAQVQPAPETPQVAAVQALPKAPETTAAVIEQASAGVWKPETTRVRIGRPVEEAACVGQLRSIARESTIFFGSGGAALSPNDLRTIRVVGRMVENCPDAIVYITGHSDPSGSREANMLLSWQRADNAARALEDLGFDIAQYEPVGFGARIPYAQGDADAELSRRVEFNIQELLWETR
jgi:outer membrane protein OmpA-like peptidoglycan-associated protein